MPCYLLLCLRQRDGHWEKLGKEGQILSSHEEGEKQTLDELLQDPGDNGIAAKGWEPQLLLLRGAQDCSGIFKIGNSGTTGTHDQGCSEMSISCVSIEASPSGCLSKDVDGVNWKREKGPWRCQVLTVADKLIHGWAQERHPLRPWGIFWGGRIFWRFCVCRKS